MSQLATTLELCSLLDHGVENNSYCETLRAILGVLEEAGVEKLPWKAILHQINVTLEELCHVDIKNVISNSYHAIGSETIALSRICEMVRQYLPADNKPIASTNFIACELFNDTNSQSDDAMNSKPVIVSGFPCRNLDGVPRRPWCPRDHEAPTSSPANWGQRKLLLMEIEFLASLLYDTNIRASHDSYVVVYAGAACGTHIPFLSAQLFPGVKFLLYDPSSFDFDPISLKLDDIMIINDFYTDEDAIFIKNICDKNNNINNRKYTTISSNIEINAVKPQHTRISKFLGEGVRSIVLISDVRRMQLSEGMVAEDLVMQAAWHKTLCPVASMLKFRLPYGAGSTRYLAGEVRLQPYLGPRSTETRLIVRASDSNTSACAEVDYDNLEYEQQCFYHNTVTRQTTHSHSCTVSNISEQASSSSPGSSTKNKNNKNKRPLHDCTGDTDNDNCAESGTVSIQDSGGFKFAHQLLSNSERGQCYQASGLAQCWDAAVEIQILQQYLESKFRYYTNTSTYDQHEDMACNKVSEDEIIGLSVAISDHLGWVKRDWVARAKKQIKLRIRQDHLKSQFNNK